MSLEDKLRAAMKYLGKNWVLANGSTYKGSRREHFGICETLRPVLEKAVKEGRV